jgi:hypothetical protein
LERKAQKGRESRAKTYPVAPTFEPAPEDKLQASTTTGSFPPQNFGTDTSPVKFDQPIQSRKSRSKFHHVINTDIARLGYSDQLSPDDGGSPTSKMKNWLKSRFSRPRGKSTSDPVNPDGNKGQSFVGGVALNRELEQDRNTPSLTSHSSSMYEVALAGKKPTLSKLRQSGETGVRSEKAGSLGSLTDSSEEVERFEEARERPMTTTPTELRSPIRPWEKRSNPNSPNRDSRFKEMMG